MNTLRQLHTQHVGKASDKWDSYLSVYDGLFGDLKDKPISLLEVGIQNGGSLEVWSRYFRNASLILGCDIDPKCADLKYEDSKIKVVVGDVNSEQTLGEIAQLADAFDVILDDGSHRSSDIIKTFAWHFGSVAPGGFYIIEDLHCSYWENWQGGLQAPFSSISFLKRLVDVVNAQHWGDGTSICEQLAFFSEQWDVDFDEAQVQQIQSVSFFNSICVIRKTTASQQLLGPRLVSGEERLVFDDQSFCSGVEIGKVKFDLDRAIFGFEAVAGRDISTMGEVANKWGPSAPSSENLVFTLGERTDSPIAFLKAIDALVALYPGNKDGAEVASRAVSDITYFRSHNTELSERIEKLEHVNRELLHSFEEVASNPLNGLSLWLGYYSAKVASKMSFLSKSFRAEMKRSSEKKSPLRFREEKSDLRP